MHGRTNIKPTSFFFLDRFFLIYRGFLIPKTYEEGSQEELQSQYNFKLLLSSLSS